MGLDEFCEIGSFIEGLRKNFMRVESNHENSQ